MAVARTVGTCLERHYLPYAVISHTRAMSSRAAARAATVPPHCIAKAVVLGDENGVLMAVIPGDSTVEIEAVSRQVGRRLRLVRDIRLTELFDDCEPGAIPPVGPAYGIETIVDDRLLELKEICFVAGDHGELLCVKREVFLMLLQGARHARIGRPSRSGVNAVPAR